MITEPVPYDSVGDEYSPVKAEVSPATRQGQQLTLIQDEDYGEEDDSSAMNDCHDDDDELDEQRRGQEGSSSIPARGSAVSHEENRITLSSHQKSNRLPGSRPTELERASGRAEVNPS